MQYQNKQENRPEKKPIQVSFIKVNNGLEIEGQK